MSPFWYACLPARLLFAALVLRFPKFGLLALIPAIGFAYLAVNPAARTEGAFGQTTWWAPWRGVHSVLWGAAAFAPHPWSAGILTVDALLGAVLKASRGD